MTPTSTNPHAAKARGSFSSIRKQAMASVVIQKSLIKWWNLNKEQPNLQLTATTFDSSANEFGELL